MDIVRFTTELSQYSSKVSRVQSKQAQLDQAKAFIKSEYEKATDAQKEAIQVFSPSIVAPFESVEAFVNSLEVEIVEEVVVEDVETDSDLS